MVPGPVQDEVLPAMLPEGRRWGRGARSVAPYLREALAMRPRNPVFTSGQFAAVVWPRRPHPPSQQES